MRFTDVLHRILGKGRPTSISRSWIPWLSGTRTGAVFSALFVMVVVGACSGAEPTPTPSPIPTLSDHCLDQGRQDFLTKLGAYLEEEGMQASDMQLAPWEDVAVSPVRSDNHQAAFDFTTGDREVYAWGFIGVGCGAVIYGVESGKYPYFGYKRAGEPLYDTFAGESLHKLDRFVVSLDWFPNADHAGLYAAQAQGFFEDEGLDVELNFGGNPEDPPKFVARDTVDLAISYQPDVILAKAEGIPITAVGAIVNVPLNSIQTLESSGITDPAQLAGKRIGYPGIPSNEVYLETILRRSGIEGGLDAVELINVGFDLGPSLYAGKVDATIGTYWNVEAVQGEMLGYPVNVLHIEDYGVPAYDELVFIASETGVREKGDLIERFLRAVVRGHEYTVENPEAAIDAVAVANPEMERELISRGVYLLVEVWRDWDRFGYMDESRWSGFVTFMRDNDLLDAEIDFDKLLTNEFVP